MIFSISMRNLKRIRQLVMLMCSQLLAFDAYAEQASLSQDVNLNQNVIASRALSPLQVNTIRAVGRHILAAKRSGHDDSADQAQLDNLRVTLDQQMTADLNTASQITPQEQEKVDERKLKQKHLDLSNTSINQTKEFIQNLHALSTSRMAETNQAGATTVKSAGFPIGKQRAEMFQKWARQLDQALTEEGANRVAKLQALRAQLESGDKQITEVHSHNNTPTIQAMPFDYVPMTTPDIADKE